MPYLLNGNCVHKKNEDGSAGELVPGGCHDTHEEAVKHLQALEIAMQQESDMSDTPMMATQIFVEALDLSEAALDRKERSARQVLIRAGESKNRRFYSEDVLQSAIHLFEGVKTYANHPSRDDLKQRPERSVRELTGWIDDVVYENGALRGTRHFLRNQAGNDSWAVVEDIIDGKAPATLMGASINAIGKAKSGKSDSGDIVIVESIEAVTSVDDVTAPAAGGGWERLVASGDEIMQSLFASLDYEEYLGARPDYVERLKREHKFVRLGESTKTAVAEADQKVKVAMLKQAEAELALTEAQEEMLGLTEANARLLEELNTARQAMAITEALKHVKLAQSYKDDLADRLPAIPMEEWASVIQKEISKARSAGASTRVPVRNAGQQVQPSPVTRPSSPVPLPDEDVDAWKARMSAINRKG